MKNSKGVTLISLTVLIIILFMISAISYQISMESYYSVRASSMSNELKLIQSKVDVLCENNELDFSNLTTLKSLEESDEKIYKKFEAYITNPEKNNIDTTKSWDLDLDGNVENYYYFSPDDLKTKLGLKDSTLSVVINIETRNIISEKPITQDGVRYYRQYDLVGGQQLINK